MFITRYSIEHRIGTQNHGEVITARDWQAIDTAIRELDGQGKTLVTLEADDEAHMANYRMEKTRIDRDGRL